MPLPVHSPPRQLKPCGALLNNSIIVYAPDNYLTYGPNGVVLLGPKSPFNNMVPVINPKINVSRSGWEGMKKFKAK